MLSPGIIYQQRHGQYPPVVYHDIAPPDLRLTPRGELFLMNFRSPKEMTMPSGGHLYVARLEYAPPELTKIASPDRRSDLYSLGATLYHLATGKLPPDARVREEAVVKHITPEPLEPAHHANTHIPSAFAEALAKAMALDPERRYQSAREMREAMRQIKQAIEVETS